MKTDDCNKSDLGSELLICAVGIGVGGVFLLGGAAVAAATGVALGLPDMDSATGEPVSSWDEHVHHQISNGLEI